ncbi:hypothetical protein I7I48_07641 [Histoplasma ohiense]|nr:hypothetical protein I7I48_07641 [Histoplasma ohiense (nom. inval.)]
MDFKDTFSPMYYTYKAVFSRGDKGTIGCLQLQGHITYNLPPSSFHSAFCCEHSPFCNIYAYRSKLRHVEAILSL